MSRVRKGTEAPRSKVAAAQPPARRPRVQAASSGAEGTNVLASKVRSLRLAARLTLQELSERSAISQSALSKIENGQLSPTYEKIAALAAGLKVDVAELFSLPGPGTPLGRRTVTRKGHGVVHSTAQYDYEMLCTELSGKQFLPMLATIKARSAQAFTPLPRHAGEEFVYVLRGQVVVHTEFYQPLALGAGDCCYFDSSMGHGLVSAEGEDATILWISSKNAFQAT